MLWTDIRACPNIELNCSLIKLMLEEAFDDYRTKEPENSYVETLTRKMESYLSVRLNLGERVSVFEAFCEYT